VSDSTHTYDAAGIKVLEGVEAIRKRPGMYVGSTGERGLRIMVSALIARAVSEFLAGRVRSVDVTLTSECFDRSPCGVVRVRRPNRMAGGPGPAWSGGGGRWRRVKEVGTPDETTGLHQRADRGQAARIGRADQVRRAAAVPEDRESRRTRDLPG
jgi:hypothetical protein